MGILIVALDGQTDIAIIACDHCGQEITRADDAAVESRSLDVADAYFVHKQCSAAFGAARMYETRKMDLGTFLVGLGKDLGVEAQ
jgi:hypothetical protein